MTVVVSPLIALMEDQVLGLLRRGVGATSLAGPIGPNEIDRRLREASRGQYAVLYVSPERLLTDQLKRGLERIDIGLLAIDEAHCISEWGHNFRPDYTRIPEIYDTLGGVPVLAVTATATHRIQTEIARLLRLRLPVIVRSGFDRPNIIFSVFRSTARRKHVNEMLDAVPGSVILYAQTRLGVEVWADYLRTRGHKVGTYHAGMQGSDRRASQFSWQHGFFRIMVATSAFGMGIDKSDVRLVIHDGMPSSLESYYQEAGRAGRDGRKAYATLLVRPDDASRSRRRSVRLSSAGQPSIKIPVHAPTEGLFSQGRALVRRLRLRSMEAVRYRAMYAYGFSETCRRQRILGYFGEYRTGSCNSCDVCLRRHGHGPKEWLVRDQVLTAIRNGTSPYRLHSTGVPVYRAEEAIDRLMQEGIIRREIFGADQFILTQTGHRLSRQQSVVPD